MRWFRKHHLTGREQENLLIMDLGSQDINGSYKEIFDSPRWNYQGLDMAPGKNVDIVLNDPYSWKEVPDNSVDVLVSGQALEHIEFFWLTFQEIARVMKPGGLACIIAPSGGPEHRYPVDCWRFYADGFKALAKYTHLKVIFVRTQWEKEGYKDGSDDWADTFMICQKPQSAT